MLAGDATHVALAFGLALLLVAAFSSGPCAGCAGGGRGLGPAGRDRASSPTTTRPLGAVCRSSGRVAVPASGRRARAPSPCASAARSRARPRRATASARRGRRRARATTTASSSTAASAGRTRARASSRRACAARRASSTPRAFGSPPGPALALDELVLYELHVGTFSPEGTFDGVDPAPARPARAGRHRDRADARRDLPGQPRLGLRRALHFAPHPAYGGPAGLARLVDAAHRAGLGVILDVVYNHVGPGNEALPAFGPYFTDRFGQTPWGEALDYSQAGVREWAIQNAELWVRDYGVDGLRLDAVHAVQDDSGRARPRRARRPRPRREPGRARDQRDGRAGLPAAARLGPRRDVARQPPPRPPRRADRRARRLLRGLRRLDGEHRGRARAARRARGSSSAPRTTTRSATARSATGCPPPSCASQRRSSSSRR